MTLEEFESKIEEFKREYLTIIKKVGADHIWMSPHNYDWYHSQHFVIDIKRNDELELELSLNVNDIYVQDRTMASRLSELKRYLQKENFKFETIGEAKEKFKEICNQFPFVLANRNRNDLVYSENDKINNIELNNIPVTSPRYTKNSNSIYVNTIFGDLYFSDEVKASFYNGLKSKGFIILAGISGIGKTKIFENFVRNFPKDNYIFIPIRPDFKDSKSLLGYYNPLSEEYQTTPLLELILNASKPENLKTPHFILFDEMNLARAEYYFADFLSVLESKRDNQGFTTQSIQLHNSTSDKVRKQGIPREIKLPPNLYFVGSVNIDETTYMFSPKILDRAWVIEFEVGDFGGYLDFVEDRLVNEANDAFLSEFRREFRKDFINQGRYTRIVKDETFLEVADKYFKDLDYLNSLLPPNLKFGYRVFDEIVTFIINSQNSIVQFSSEDEAFDLAIKMKILPKFHGTQDRLENVFYELLEFAKEKKLFHTSKKVQKMINDLSSMGYTSFM